MRGRLCSRSWYDLYKTRVHDKKAVGIHHSAGFDAVLSLWSAGRLAASHIQR